MLCRRCGITGDRLRPKWWHRIIPGVHRYYCAGCGRKYLCFGTAHHAPARPD